MNNPRIFTPTVSVVIPILNAEPYLPQLFEKIFAQELASVTEILLVDSGSTDASVSLAEKQDRTRVIEIKEFTHGGARNLGARYATGDIVVFMTQDALPKNSEWLACLLQPFKDEKVAAVCSRQIPRSGATPMEQFFLAKRFGNMAETRNLSTLEKVGYEDVLFSDVSCAVRREVLLRYPFDETLIMSEDQQLSRDLIKAGYSVVYQPDSVVVHSHSYTLWQTFKRYFDSVCALRVIFKDQDMRSSAAMGRRYVIEELKFIAKKYPLWLPYYFAYTTVKVMATILAHHTHYLPRWVLCRISMHSYHWK